MKNIVIKSIGVFSAFALLSTGCIKETFPEGSVQTAAQVAKSEGALQAMANSIPVSMMASNTARYTTTYEVHTDFGIGAIHIMTENMLEDWATMGDNPYYNRFYANASNQDQGSRFIYCAYYWTCYYQWIKSANNIISVVNPAEATPDALVFLGEAYAYRASFYLDLARLFEPKTPGTTYKDDKGNVTYDVSHVLGLTVPIVTPETTEEQAKKNPRATHDDMYKFILEDLTKAAGHLEKATSGYSRPTLDAVNGLFARAYLEMGAYCRDNNDAKAAEYYKKAAEYAQLVIDSGRHAPLTQAQWEDPKTGFNSGASNTAWIWGLTLSSESTINIITYSAHVSSEASWGYAPLAQIGISRALYNQIDDNDFRKHSWLDPRRDEYYKYKFAGNERQIKGFLEGTTENPAARNYQNIKFRPAQGETSDYGVGNCADHCLMRVEEMYFIKAEALARTGDLAGAQAALDAVIKTRLSSYSSAAKGSNENSFIDELLLQKRIEFWGEGILIFDYKRLGAGITRGYEGTNHAPVYSYNSEGRSPQWNFVITRGEFQANKAINDDTNNPDPSGLLPLWSE